MQSIKNILLSVLIVLVVVSGIFLRGETFQTDFLEKAFAANGEEEFQPKIENPLLAFVSKNKRQLLS